MQDGCTPNVVTFNTLIDVHGKMGNWEEAVGVLDAMKREVGDGILLSQLLFWLGLCCCLALLGDF